MGRLRPTSPARSTSRHCHPPLRTAVRRAPGENRVPRTVETSRRSESAAGKDTHDKPLRGWLSETSLPPSEKEIKRCTGVLEIRTATTSAFHYVPMILYTHPSLYSFINL